MTAENGLTTEGEYRVRIVRYDLAHASCAACGAGVGDCVCPSPHWPVDTRDTGEVAVTAPSAGAAAARGREIAMAYPVALFPAGPSPVMVEVYDVAAVNAVAAEMTDDDLAHASCAACGAGVGDCVCPSPHWPVDVRWCEGCDARARRVSGEAGADEETLCTQCLAERAVRA